MNNAASVSRTRWLWVALVSAPLAVVGCQGNRTVQTPPPDDQRVAGERQEAPSAEVLQAIRDGGLPETFQFGGRVWRGHEIHRTTRDKVHSPDAAAGTADVFDFHPVADLKAEGHVIYRRAGLDEAMTDNIFLMAGGAGAGGTTSGATEGMSPSTDPASTATGNDVVFIEYDPIQSMDANADVTQVLPAANLPQTVQWKGRTFAAREVQVYDPDVFDEVKAVTGMTGGHPAYQGDDQDHLFLMGVVSEMPMGGTATGEGTTGTGDPAANAPDAGTEAGTTTFSGPIFVRYEAGEGNATGTGVGGANPSTSAPGTR